MTRPITAKTLDGQVTLWPDGLELTFSGLTASAEKKRVSPTLVRLADVEAVELSAPRGIRRGVLQVHARGAAPSTLKPERDPLAATYSVGHADAVLRLCWQMADRGVAVVGLPPRTADPIPASAPSVAPVPAPVPAATAQLHRVMTWQMRLLNFQLATFAFGAVVLLAVVVLFVVAVARA